MTKLCILLTALAVIARARVAGPDGPYPNRRDAGERVYLTARICPPRNPAAPLPHTPPRSLPGGTRHDHP